MNACGMVRLKMIGRTVIELHFCSLISHFVFGGLMNYIQLEAHGVFLVCLFFAFKDLT